MWIVTKVGFFSAVAHRENKNIVIVRARVRADLNRLRDTYMKSLGPTVKNDEADYPYRASITKRAFAAGMANAALDVDYDNFKHRVGELQGHERANVYLEAWSVFTQLEDSENRRNRMRKRFGKYLMSTEYIDNRYARHGVYPGRRSEIIDPDQLAWGDAFVTHSDD